MSFGSTNILTAKANSSYTTEELRAEAELSYVKSKAVNYFGTVGRISYIPKNVKWLNLFGEASYVNSKQAGAKIEGYSVQAGVKATF